MLDVPAPQPNPDGLTAFERLTGIKATIVLATADGEVGETERATILEVLHAAGLSDADRAAVAAQEPALNGPERAGSSVASGRTGRHEP